MQDDSRILMLRSVGQPLLKVEGLIYVPTGESVPPLDRLDTLQVTFGNRRICFRCGADGETLVINECELRAIDLGEYGELRPADLSQAPQYARFIGTPLRRCSSIVSHECLHIVGVMLEFTAGVVAICNWGDELEVWNDIPISLFADEGIRIEPLS
jgi:hypothetical protein